MYEANPRGPKYRQRWTLTLVTKYCRGTDAGKADPAGEAGVGMFWKPGNIALGLKGCMIFFQLDKGTAFMMEEQHVQRP